MSAISNYLSQNAGQNKAMIQYIPDKKGDTFYDDKTTNKNFYI